MKKLKFKSEVDNEKTEDTWSDGSELSEWDEYHHQVNTWFQFMKHYFGENNLCVKLIEGLYPSGNSNYQPPKI